MYTLTKTSIKCSTLLCKFRCYPKMLSSSYYIVALKNVEAKKNITYLQKHGQFFSSFLATDEQEALSSPLFSSFVPRVPKVSSTFILLLPFSPKRPAPTFPSFFLLGLVSCAQDSSVAVVGIIIIGGKKGKMLFLNLKV